MRILLTEDDYRLSKKLVRVLTREHYIVDAAFNSEEALQFIKTFPYDLLILDIVLPGEDGITLCRKLRDRNYKIPILLLTAKNANEDKIKAFDAGADDYLVKPFNLQELLARIKALLRRNYADFIKALEWENLCVIPENKKVTYEEKKINLTITEYQLLELFLRHKQRLFSCGDIIEHLYLFDDPPTENTIRSHIRGLRKKLKNTGCPDLIDTVHGFGYRLKLDKSGENTEKKPVSSSKDKIQTALALSWHEFKDSIFLDTVFLEELGIEFEKNTASEKLPEAIRVAHNLVGILGSLGLHEAALISREIENLLEEGSREISEPLVELRRLLEERSNIRPHHPSLEEEQNLWDSKILVIDDDPNFLSAIQAVLESEKLKIYGLTEPIKFWESLEAVSPDLLILDLKMPDIEGTKICELIRKEPRYQTLPILFVSAYLNQENIQQLVAAGADDFTNKSALKQELKHRVLCHLQRVQRLKMLIANC
ncbi:MAG: response regulator [Cyanobacteriota bacterium]|nr:response regulator [Cyanobacteriota bacterium]